MAELVDRKRVAGGISASHVTVEQAIWAHPAVRGCAVVALRHADSEDAPTAFVELDDDAELSENDLLAFCRERVGQVRAPERIVYVSELRRHR